MSDCSNQHPNDPNLPDYANGKLVPFNSYCLILIQEIQYMLLTLDEKSINKDQDSVFMMWANMTIRYNNPNKRSQKQTHFIEEISSLLQELAYPDAIEQCTTLCTIILPKLYKFNMI